MSERPPTTMVRGSESETPHLRVEMPRDVYKRLARAERQVAAVRDELSTLPALADAFRSMGDTTAGTAIEQVCRDIRRALETE